MDQYLQKLSWYETKPISIETMLQTTCFYLIQTFLKKRKRSGTVFLAHFLHDFFKKIISIVILYYLTKFDWLAAFTLWDIGQYVYYNCLLTRFWRHKFWNYPYLSNQVIFSHGQYLNTKIEISWEWGEILRWNKNHFSSLLKGFQWSK